MAQKQNCWEVKKCGRQPGGGSTSEHGVCPAATNVSHNGVNQGQKAGRYCWAVAGTLCGGKVQGDYAAKRVSCMSCEFFSKVKSEEAKQFVFDDIKTRA